MVMMLRRQICEFRGSDGIAVGASFVEVKAKYPAATVEPHKYVPGGHYLTLKNPDGSKAVLLEEADGKITEIRAGTSALGAIYRGLFLTSIVRPESDPGCVMH